MFRNPEHGQLELSQDSPGEASSFPGPAEASCAGCGQPCSNSWHIGGGLLQQCKAPCSRPKVNKGLGDPQGPDWDRNHACMSCSKSCEVTPNNARTESGDPWNTPNEVTLANNHEAIGNSQDPAASSASSEIQGPCVSSSADSNYEPMPSSARSAHAKSIEDYDWVVF